MNIADTALNIKPETIEYTLLNVLPGNINFSWWLFNSFKSFFNSPILSCLLGKEGSHIEIQPLAQEIEGKGSLLEKDLKENLLPAETNRLSEFNQGESTSGKFLSLINALDSLYSSFPNDLSIKSENKEDLLLVRETRAEDTQEIPELLEKKVIIPFSHQNGQEKIGLEQGRGKMTLLSEEEKLLPNLFIEEDKLINSAKEKNLNFSTLKDTSKEGEIIGAQKAPAPLNSIIAEKITKEEIPEIQKEMAKNQQVNLAFSAREGVEQTGSDYFDLDMAAKNGWPFLVKDEGKKLTSPGLKENNFENFSLLGKENDESQVAQVEQSCNNLTTTGKSFFVPFSKGEKRGEIKLDDFSPFSTGITNKDTIISRDSFAATGEVGSQENIWQWRPAESEIYKQISQKIIWSVKNDQEQIKVTLEPPHLGNIYLEVTREKENIRAKILAENPLTKELIEQNYWPIQKILEKEGFRLEKFDVFSQFDMDFGGEAKEENLARNSQGKLYPFLGEINEPLSLESGLPWEANKGCINILI